MYYNAHGSGDFTKYTTCDLKPFFYSTAAIGVVLFQISNTDRENQLKPLIALLSKNTLS